MQSENKLSIKAGGRVWIELCGKASIGQGKIELLEKAAKYGSLRQAAIEMQISYRQAWYKINQMNKITNEPLLILKRGGVDGGSAILTKLGEKIISDFHTIQQNFDSFLKNQSNQL